MSYIERYAIGKANEEKLLTYLNTYQPFEYYNILNNEVLPITPYYPSLYKYSKFDLYNDYITIDLKTRTDNINTTPFNFLDVHKIINNHSIFCFSYENQINSFTSSSGLNDLHFINYSSLLFSTFETSMVKGSDVFYIPKDPTYFLPLDTKKIHSYSIPICYDELYIKQLKYIIAKDKTSYLSQFGFLSC